MPVRSQIEERCGEEGRRWFTFLAFAFWSSRSSSILSAFATSDDLLLDGSPCVGGRSGIRHADQGGQLLAIRLTTD